MHYEYDATAEKCPQPLVKMRVLLKKMQQGDTCLMHISDKGSIKDIPKLLIKQGYSFDTQVIEHNVMQLHIKK